MTAYLCKFIEMVYVYVPVFWGYFFANFGIAFGGFLSGISSQYLNKIIMIIGNLSHDQGHGNYEHKCEFGKKRKTFN